MKLKILIVLILTFQIIIEKGYTQSFPLAFTEGTVGANVSQIRGNDARFVNPALIGLSGNSHQVISFPSFAYRFGNNSISNNQMNAWFKKNRYWTKSERETFVRSIKNEFKIEGKGGLGLGYQFKNFALAYDAIGFLDTGIPDEFFDLFAFGNRVNTNYHLGGIRGGAWFGSTISFSFAKPFRTVHFADEFSIGISLKYIIGHNYAGINKAEGSIFTSISPDTIIAHGNFLTARSTSGDGISMDLGTAAKVGENLTFSIALLNLGGKINWDGTKINEDRFEVLDDGVPIDSIHQENFLENWANYKSTTLTNNGHVSIKLPTFLQLASDYRIHKDWYLFSSFLQGVNKGNQVIGASPIGKFAIGGEWTKLQKLPLRMGVAFGGNTKFEMGMGIGYRLSNYSADLAFTYEGGLFNAAKGYGFAFSHRYILN